MVVFSPIPQRRLFPLSERPASTLSLRPGRWTAIVWVTAAALLAAFALACAAEPTATPPPALPAKPTPVAPLQPIDSPLPTLLRPGGPLTAATWLDADRMYLADADGNIRLLNVATEEIKTILEGLSVPQGLTILDGRLYLSDLGNVCALLPTVGCVRSAKGTETENLARLAQSRARILSYRIGDDGALDDQRIVVDGILALERTHSPNGLTNDGEWIYASIGHPWIEQPHPQGNYITDAAAELAAAGGRPDLMGVIARFRPGDRDVEIYATGFRNTYGISIGPDGILYGADNDAKSLAARGQLEELNAIVPGGFYGYPFWGTNEAPPEAGVTEPVAVLSGVASTFAYANEQGVYVAYLSLPDAAGAGGDRFVVDHFDYESFTPTRVIRNAPSHITAILEREGLLYLVTFSGVIMVIDPTLPPEEQLSRYKAGLAASADRIIAQHTPDLLTDYAVYRWGQELLYVQDPCAPPEMERQFYLHIAPVNPEDLPDSRKEHGFENRDFRFGGSGLRHRGRCLAFVSLPDYAILEIRTGYADGSSGGVIRPE